MKHHGTPHSACTVREFLRDPMALVRALLFPRRLAPVPVSARGRAGGIRWVPASRRIGRWPLAVGVLLLAASATWAGPPVLPAGVPNIFDPAVQLHFVPVETWGLRGNPEFPMVLFVNTAGEQPRALLLGVDARNGTDTWSLTADPIILIGVFVENEMTLQRLYVDTGFLGGGTASGHYSALEQQNSAALLDLLKAVTAAAPRTGI